MWSFVREMSMGFKNKDSLTIAQPPRSIARDA